MVQPPDEADSPHRSARGGPLSSERARDITRGFLLARSPEASGTSDDVLLVVSELVTNAIRHAGGVADFRLEQRDNCVVVTVSDPSPHPPRARVPVASGLGGFGWHLVRRLASHVQVDTYPLGKTVRVCVPLA